MGCKCSVLSTGAKNNKGENDRCPPSRREKINEQLLAAVRLGRVEVISELIEKGTDVNAPLHEGNTYLIHAVIANQTESVKALLGGGSDVNAQRTDGMSPLNVASYEGFTDIVKMLLDNAADVESRNSHGSTPLCNAVRPELCENLDVIRLLIDRGAVVNTQSNYGISPLMVACLRGRLETLTLLLKHGAHINAQDNDGFTPLHFASKAGNADIVARLLSEGADAKLTNKSNQSCLLEAAFGGHIDVISKLVHAGVDVNLQRNDGASPLSVASQEGHADIVRLLLHHGAKVEIRDIDGATPLYWAVIRRQNRVVRLLIQKQANINACLNDGQSCLHGALYRGNTNVVRALVSAGADINLQRNDGASLLSVASQEGHADIVRLLLHHGAMVEVRNNDGATPLYWAARKGHVEIVHFLIQRHANVDARHNDGESCILAAVCGGHIDIVRALMSAGANVNMQRNDGASPLSKASEIGRVDIVRLLVHHGAKIEMRDDDGATSLYWAATKGHAEIMKFLIQRRANVNVCRNDRQSCIQEAVCNGYTYEVSLLLSAGADVNFQRNDGSNPLITACQTGNFHIVRMLVDHGAKIEIRDNDGATPLYWAAKKGHAEIVHFLLHRHASVNASRNDGQSCIQEAVCGGHTEVVSLLVSAGADVNIKSNDGSTLLITASMKQNFHIVSMLLDHGAKIDIRDNEGATPLYWASELGHTEIVQLMIEHNDDINASCNDGTSCLLGALFGGHTNVVRILVSAGADVNLQRNDGASPLSVASQGRHSDIVKLLLNRGARKEMRYSNRVFLPNTERWTKVLQLWNQYETLEYCEYGAALPEPDNLDEVELQFHDDSSSLIFASRIGNIDTVRQLVQSGADVDMRNVCGETPLYSAASNGCIDVVQFLIEHNADVNACCRAVADDNLQHDGGTSPLSVASKKGYAEIVRLLLTNKADSEMRDSYGCTALFRAAQNGQTSVLDALIDHGADVDAITYNRRSPLCQAAVQGKINTVKILLRNNANFTCTEGDCAYTPTFVAALCEHEVEAILQLMINYDAYEGPVRHCDTYLTLVYAAYSGRLSVVKILAEHGFDVHERTYNSFEAADVAGYYGHVNIVSFLNNVSQSRSLTNTLQKCIITSITDDNTDCCCNTALHLTTDVQQMRSWLEKGANIEAENVIGLRPIHCAVRTGIVELVELLIQHGANVDAEDVFGNRPLHDAVSHGLDVVQLLIQSGAKLDVQNTDGKTPLHIAVERQLSDVIRLLFEKHADSTLTDVWRNTPLHYLCPNMLTRDAFSKCSIEHTNRDQHMSTENALDITTKKIMDYLKYNVIGNQADTNPGYVDRYGNTLLHCAVGVFGHLKMHRVSADVEEIVDFLVERGADINAQNDDGLTPLHVARGEEATKACLKHADDQSFTVADKRGRNFWHLLFLLHDRNEVELAIIIQPLLFESEAKYRVDDLDRTPLHYACMRRSNSPGVCKWLATKFVNSFDKKHIKKQDKFGRTALHYAAIANNKEIMDSSVMRDVGTVRDKFGKTAEHYTAVCHNYSVKLAALRLFKTSNTLARKFSSTALCIQRCFFDESQSRESYKAEMQALVNELRGESDTSFVLNSHNGCHVDYYDICCKVEASNEHTRKQKWFKRNNNATSLLSPPTLCEAITEQVKNSMDYLAVKIAKKEHRFACKVVMVGSAHERTEIGFCDEFDFSFVLTKLSKSCKVCPSPESPPGFVMLKAATKVYDEELFDSNGILDTRITKFHFEILVKQILSSVTFCEATGFEFVDPAQDFSLPRGTISTKLHTHIKLKFTEPVNGCHVPHSISVDIVPVLVIDDWWREYIHKGEYCEKGDCLIVFTQPQLKYPWISAGQSHMDSYRLLQQKADGCVTVLVSSKLPIRLSSECPSTSVSTSSSHRTS